MRGIQDHQVPKIKLGLHAFQAACVTVAWICEIIVFQKAKITGNNGWVFGLCFMSIPAWIYLIMTPRFDKTRRFAEPHAMLALDVLFTILWLSAFAAQAAYNTYGNCDGACGASKTIVGLGVLTCLSWIPCIILSMYTLQYYNNNSRNLPGYEQRRRFGDGSIDPDKAAFSMNPHDDDGAYTTLQDEENHDHNDAYASGAFGGSQVDGSRLDPYDEGESQISNGGYGGYGSAGRVTPLFDSNTEYSGTMNSRFGPSPVHPEIPPATSPAPVYEDHMIPHGGVQGHGGMQGHSDMPYGPDDIQAVRFPAGNYDRMT